MTENEWLQIGYDKAIIDIVVDERIDFQSAYKEWFLMKKNCVKAQSLDRIEVTYNKYFNSSDFNFRYVNEISDLDIVNFLTPIILEDCISFKELQRIMQIIRGTLVFFHDIKRGGVPLHDWDMIKRYLPLERLQKKEKHENAVSVPDVENLIYNVVNRKIYAVKQCGCLALCMNFYLGLRIGELASLTFNDFDFERNVVKIYKTESKFYDRDENGSKLGVLVYKVVEDCKTVYSVREIPLLPEVIVFYNLIKEWHEVHGIEDDFLASDGDDVILVQSLATTLRKLCLLSDIPYFNSHLIRKTFATKLHFSGVPTRVVSDLLGHSEIGTTENSYILSYGKEYNNILSYLRKGLNYEIKKPVIK